MIQAPSHALHSDPLQYMIRKEKEYLPNKGLKELFIWKVKRKAAVFVKLPIQDMPCPHQNLDCLNNHAKLTTFVSGKHCNPLQTFYNSIKYFNLYF